MQQIDFSCKHDILLEDEDGVLVPMDEPYFRAKAVANGTWLILSDGDYSYLLEGEDEAIVIDSGYGAGNIRAFCQTLTTKPIYNIINTHDHFDHTANNSYFDCAYMSAETRPLATIPFPSFAGIDFPRDYKVVEVDDGDIVPLRGRDLQVFKIPDHAVGSIVILDRRERILFSGDELGMAMGKPLNGTVERWAAYMEKLLIHRTEFDRILGGFGEIDGGILEKYLENALYILAGHEGLSIKEPPFPNFSAVDAQGRAVWKRRLPHPGDGPKKGPGEARRLVMDYAGCKLIYDEGKVHM